MRQKDRLLHKQIINEFVMFQLNQERIFSKLKYLDSLDEKNPIMLYTVISAPRTLFRG
jgi:hypothetical protein